MTMKTDTHDDADHAKRIVAVLTIALLLTTIYGPDGRVTGRTSVSLGLQSRHSSEEKIRSSTALCGQCAH
jgi:hypothetical protein